jgi:oxepin-CoA hydrolase/3-oxo-5,6-dehydrosuberyl-CoA semialdehyde dehydrogenase
LFVWPNKGPVAANYGLEECRFLRPIYHNDTMYVRLTCKQKIERDHVGEQLPSGIVKWFVEVFDQNDELTAVATILTMVQKKSPFTEIKRSNVDKYLDKLTVNHKANWGTMTPQHMVEHMEQQFRFASGQKGDFDIATPAEHLDKFRETIFSHRPFPKGHKHPLMSQEKNEDLQHTDLQTAKAKLLEAFDAYEQYFKENPEARTKNVVFGMMDKFEWDLLATKHFNHHFRQFGILD